MGADMRAVAQASRCALLRSHNRAVARGTLRAPRSSRAVLAMHSDAGQRPIVDMEHTASIFRSKSLWELLRAAMIFRVARTPWLMDPAKALLTWSMEAEGAMKVLLGPVRWTVKQTAFLHFCAGETLQDCQQVATAAAQDGVRLILDHSIEEREEPDAWGENLEAKCQLLHSLSKKYPGQAAFMPVKVTALASPAMLEDFTQHIHQHGTSHSTPLPDTTAHLLEASLGNLRLLCEASRKAGIPVLFDAEQSYRQPAVDHIAVELMKEFNVQGMPPLVYNTYQMYLKDALDRVRLDVQAAVEGQYTFAAKVVRGAYLTTEHQRAQERGLPIPTHNSKADTDVAYDAAVQMVLEQISMDADAAAIVVATHNRASVLAAIRWMRELGLAPDHERVALAQIMGMCDNITLALGQSRYNSHKLVLFGEFDEYSRG